LASAMIAASCASDPATAAEDTVVAAVPEVADVVASMRRAAPGAESVTAPLDEPALPEPVDAVAPAAAAVADLPIEPAPTDITVLSAAPSIAFEPVRLPEPAPPAPVAPPAVAPATKPVAKPAPTTTPQAKPASPAKTEPTPAAAPKPAAAPVGATAPEPEPEPEPAIALPPTPASSARSVVAAAEKPVAETRIETTKGERFELRFPGTGWIYLGDEDGKEGMRYETRRFEDTQAVFALDPESPGEYLLRFQRQNPVDRATETSLVRVVVHEKPIASDTPATAPPAAAASAIAPSAAPAPAVASTAPAPASAPAPETSAQAAISAAAGISDPAALIRLAKTELEAKRVQSAIEALDRYLSLYPYGNDEVFYLYGLAYEQDTPFRNVKKAYEYYRRVKDEYPRSSRWREASDKVAYLERHFFGLR